MNHAHEQQGLHCPGCGQLDQVSRVRSLVEAQTTTQQGTSLGDSIHFAVSDGSITPIFGWNQQSSSSTTRSDLAQVLAAPTRPPHPVLNTLMLKLGSAVAWFVGTIVLWFVIAFSWVLATPSPDYDEEAHYPLGKIFLFVLVAMTLLVGWFLRRKLDQRKHTYAVELDHYQRESVTWPARMRVWDESCVCLRCYRAFIPRDALGMTFPGSHRIHLERFQEAVRDMGEHLADSASDRHLQPA